MKKIQQEEFKTTCSYCGVGCGIIAQKSFDNKITVKGDKNHPVNRGMLCSKGMNLDYVANNVSDRIMHPEMRWSKSHPRERVSWDTGLDRAARVFKTLIQKYGPDSVGFYVSGQCLTEEYYIANKLTKGFLGTNNIDTNSRLCMSSAVVAYKKTFGEDSVPVSYDDIELADCFLIAGANPAWCHPILFRRLEKHKEENPDEVKVIVVDPRRTDSARFADLHLQLIPGTDIILFNAIGRRLIERGYIDKKFIKTHTENFPDYKKQAYSLSLKKAAKECGVSVEEIKEAAELIGRSKGFISMWAMGLNQSSVGTDKNFALLNLSLITGKVGKPGNGPFSLTGQPNAMGGREVGGMASLLAVHKNLNNPDHRQEVADFWGVDEISEKPGYTATEMFDALESGKLKAVWIACTNPMVSLPDVRKAEAALKKAKFVVVQEISHKSDTLEYADLVLPAAGWMEKEGTMTNSERRISYLPKALTPPGEARADVEIFCDFAQRMGFSEFNYNSTEEIYAEYCEMTKGTNIDISHLNYDRLKNEGSIQWPVPEYRHPGTKRLFEDHQFYTVSKKAIFNIPASIDNTSTQPDEEFPLILTTGRVRDQWHSMTKTGKVSRLRTHYSSPVLEINPVDGIKNFIKNGEVVEVESENGNVRLRAKITKDVRPGVLFLPMHWGKQLKSDLNRANNLTFNQVDPQSKEPDFKFTRVSVSKYKKPVEKIIIIGAGAAAFRFVQNYRDHNSDDELHVFSEEAHPFYNRVLLPEYVTEELSWEKLLKIKEVELGKLNLQLHKACSISKIDKNEKWVTDHRGNKHHFDKLIIATGSRAFVPKDAQLDSPGRFTMRSKADADEFKTYLEKTGLPPEEQHVVIVGGGLLGLELAAALQKEHVNITIVQRSSRLMERQLDILSSRLLARDVQERGINIYFDNEVSTVFDDEENPGELTISLKSGKILNAHAIAYAIGTRPNIEIAKESGLTCGRGVKVNEHLQTSNPDIFAIGEIAEYKGQLFGITSAAEEQAEVLSNFLAGDVGSIYRGSVLMNILKFKNLDLCSVGDINVPENDPAYEEIVFTDVSKRYYKKCIVKNDLLVGAILMGDKNEFAQFKTLIESKMELADKRDTLLRCSGNSKPVKGKLVCSCSQVGAGNLQEAIKNGNKDFTTLCKETGAGLGCGSCKTEVRELLVAG